MIINLGIAGPASSSMADDRRYRYRLRQALPDHPLLADLDETYSWIGHCRDPERDQQAVANFLRFAERQGIVGLSKVRPCAHGVLRGPRFSGRYPRDCRAPDDRSPCVLPEADHLSVWRTAGGAIVLVSQPYGEPSRALLDEWAEQWEFEVRVRHPRESWHNPSEHPSATWLIEVTHG